MGGTFIAPFQDRLQALNKEMGVDDVQVQRRGQEPARELRQDPSLRRAQDAAPQPGRPRQFRSGRVATRRDGEESEHGRAVAHAEGRGVGPRNDRVVAHARQRADEDGARPVGGDVPRPVRVGAQRGVAAQRAAAHQLGRRARALHVGRGRLPRQPSRRRHAVGRQPHGRRTRQLAGAQRARPSHHADRQRRRRSRPTASP